MKKFIATEKNIQQITGELNKVFMKNHYFGHHLIVSSYSRKTGKRPKRIHIIGRQKQYFTVLAERTDPMTLCDINCDTDNGFDFLTIICAGDIVIIDVDKVYIISKDVRKRFKNNELVTYRILRKCYSIIPATEATAEHLNEFYEESSVLGSTMDGVTGLLNTAD